MEILLSIVCIIVVFVICGRAVIMDVRNPKPLMENGDKRFDDVKKVKTRSIFHVEVR